MPRLQSFTSRTLPLEAVSRILARVPALSVLYVHPYDLCDDLAGLASACLRTVRIVDPTAHVPVSAALLARLPSLEVAAVGQPVDVGALPASSRRLTVLGNHQRSPDGVLEAVCEAVCDAAHLPRLHTVRLAPELVEAAAGDDGELGARLLALRRACGDRGIAVV